MGKSKKNGKFIRPRNQDRFLKTGRQKDLIEWCPICDREIMFEEGEPIRGKLYHPECAVIENNREANAERMVDDVLRELDESE